MLLAGCALTPPNTFASFVNYISCIISTSLIPLIVTLAIAVFVWGVVQYLLGANEEAKREKGRQFILWSVIALTAMVSIWGLVQVLGNTFGVQYVIPQVQNASV